MSKLVDATVSILEAMKKHVKKYKTDNEFYTSINKLIKKKPK